MAHIDVPSLRVTKNSADSPDPKMSVLSALCKELVPLHGLGTTLSLVFPAQRVSGRGPTASNVKDHPPTLLSVNTEGMCSVSLPVSPTLQRITYYHDSLHPLPTVFPAEPSTRTSARPSQGSVMRPFNNSWPKHLHRTLFLLDLPPN